MSHDPFGENPFAAFVRPWHEGEVSADPFEALIQYQRAEARYLEEELGDIQKAKQANRFADRLEKLIAAVRDLNLTYEQAARICSWTYSTIKNKASAGEIAANRGKVPVHQLLIAPRTTGLHAIRLVDAVEEARAAEAKGEKRGKTEDERRAFLLGQNAD